MYIYSNANFELCCIIRGNTIIRAHTHARAYMQTHSHTRTPAYIIVKFISQRNVLLKPHAQKNATNVKLSGSNNSLELDSQLRLWCVSRENPGKAPFGSHFSPMETAAKRKWFLNAISYTLSFLFSTNPGSHCSGLNLTRTLAPKQRNSCRKNSST